VELFSEFGVERILVSVGEVTSDSILAGTTGPGLLSSSSEKVPDDRRPDLHGGLVDNAALTVLTDLLFDFDISLCRL